MREVGVDGQIVVQNNPGLVSGFQKCLLAHDYIDHSNGGQTGQQKTQSKINGQSGPQPALSHLLSDKVNNPTHIQGIIRAQSLLFGPQALKYCRLRIEMFTGSSS
jgi:hypothetical protein